MNKEKVKRMSFGEYRYRRLVSNSSQKDFVNQSNQNSHQRSFSARSLEILEPEYPQYANTKDFMAHEVLDDDVFDSEENFTTCQSSVQMTQKTDNSTAPSSSTPIQKSDIRRSTRLAQRPRRSWAPSNTSGRTTPTKPLPPAVIADLRKSLHTMILGLFGDQQNESEPKNDAMDQDRLHDSLTKMDTTPRKRMSIGEYRFRKFASNSSQKDFAESRGNKNASAMEILANEVLDDDVFDSDGKVTASQSSTAQLPHKSADK